MVWCGSSYDNSKKHYKYVSEKQTKGGAVLWRFFLLLLSVQKQRESSDYEEREREHCGNAPLPPSPPHLPHLFYYL